MDRIVLNAYFSLGHNPGGFRVWWRRLHEDSDEQLDNTRLMRMAGLYSQALAQVADTLSQQATVGRLSQVCDRWIYSACLCFGLDSEEQSRSGFHYSYSIYQVEHGSNLLFRVGGQLDRVFNAMVDRTRSRLDVPTLRTLFGVRVPCSSSTHLEKDRTVQKPEVCLQAP